MQNEQALLVPLKFTVKPLFQYTSYIISVDANDLNNRDIRWFKYNGYKIYTLKKVYHDDQ